MATTKAGIITIADVVRESKVNGELNTYTFSLTTTVPILDGDVLKFTFPEQVVVSQSTVCTPLNADDVIVCGISGNDI